MKFITNAVVIKLYETASWRIGVDQIPDVYLTAESRNTTFVGKKTTIFIFGIPI